MLKSDSVGWSLKSHPGGLTQTPLSASATKMAEPRFAAPGLRGATQSAGAAAAPRTRGTQKQPLWWWGCSRNTRRKMSIIIIIIMMIFLLFPFLRGVPLHLPFAEMSMCYFPLLVVKGHCFFFPGGLNYANERKPKPCWVPFLQNTCDPISLPELAIGL